MIMNVETIESKISKLRENTIAQFGIMSPQHMIEHLTITIKISYEKIKLPDFEPTKRQLAQKEALIHTDLEFPKGIKTPGLEDKLLDLRYPDLETAKRELLKSIDEYNRFFHSNPDKLTTHPVLGKLSHPEWEEFHSKHIRHHLSQFNL
jgi:oxepin-CoA hydrolase/3-oxo-5,6-dehydrosuberyl-CoA semialdehyde dehydrogenase